MIQMLLKKILLSILIITLLSVSLSGCDDTFLDDILNQIGEIDTDSTKETNIEENTGTIYIILSGDDLYDVSLDGAVKLYNVTEGQYTLSEVPYGDHTFEAIATSEEDSCVRDIVGKDIKIPETYIYLTPIADDGSVTIYLTSTYSDHHYNIKMDGREYHSNVPTGTIIYLM